MKIVARINENDFICELNAYELQKFMGNYYSTHHGLKVGEVINLGKGYDHMVKISESLSAMEKVCNDVEKITEAIRCGKQIKKSAIKQALK